MNESEVLSYLTRCLRIDGGTAKPDQFLKDLVETVCTLQRDGLYFIFAHRSFQEFFAAYCLAYTTNKHFEDVLMKMARRPTDSVIKMLCDMKKDLVEDRFLLPRLRSLQLAIADLPTNERFLVCYTRPSLARRNR